MKTHVGSIFKQYLKLLLEGMAREDPEVRNEVARLWREYSDCRARALGREPLTRDWQEGRTDSKFAPQPARGLPF